MRVLIVEDDPASSECMAEMMRFWGHDGRTAADGAEAFAAIESFTPDTAVVDFQLPDVDGTEVVRRLRERFGRDVLIILFTGFSDPRHRQRGKDAGADAFLIKPVDFGSLKKLLDEPRADGSDPRGNQAL